MNILEVATPDLLRIAKELFSDRCVVAITPAAGDSRWVEKTAWNIARAAASTGRRTALIDLDLDDPRLHSQAREPKDTGIVDAFLFGASLQHVASQEETPNLHFIGVGTPPGEPEEVWANDRWQRLFRGFKKEEAILLLFLPPAALECVALAPDLILAVAPRGFDATGPDAPQLRSAIDRGVPMAVVTDGPEPAPTNQSADPDDRVAQSEQPVEATDRRSGLPRKVVLSVFGVVVAATIAVLVLLQSNRGTVPDTPEPMPEAPLPAGFEDSTPQTAEPLVEADAVPQAHTDSVVDTQEAEELTDRSTTAPEIDSLRYSIQVAAWGQLSQARDHVAQFFSAGVAATITAVPRDSSRLWYRVFVGATTDYGAASDLRQSLRVDGLIGSTRGVLLETPLALLLETHPDTLSGREAARGLRESGIPAYIVSMPDGTAQVLLGAFESPDQADLIISVLPEAGRNLSRTLVSRVGIAR